MEVPRADQFELLSYSQVAGHRFDQDATKRLDVNKLKEMVIKEVFTLVGHRRLVKVIPRTAHNDLIDNDTQYPPGLGVPQWKLVRPVSARVVAVIAPAKV